MHTPSSDYELVARLVRKDPSALFELYKTYQVPLSQFIRTRLRDDASVDEVVQDVFIQFLERLRDFRGECSLKTYLFTIARNKTIDAIRKKKLKHVLFSALPSFFVDSLSAVVMDDRLERAELEEKLRETFAQLPHDYQVILRLKYVENISVVDIAQQLKRSFKSTESLLYRARQAFVVLYHK